MSVLQWILLFLIALVFIGACFEASAHESYRLTSGRLALAIVVPLLWVGALFMPWEMWYDAAPSWAQMLAPVLFGAVAIGGFVLSVCWWVVGALAGYLRDDVRAMFRRGRQGED